MQPPLTYFPAHCPNCSADLTDELGEGGFWKLSDPTYSTSQILQDITCPECGLTYAYARTKTGPISRHRCLRDECMWWQRPVGHSRRDAGRCGMLKFSCPFCGAIYFGPGHRPKETDRCGYCQNPIRAIYLTNEEYEVEVIHFGEDLEEHQSWRAYAAGLDAREYRGGLSRWGVEA